MLQTMNRLANVSGPFEVVRREFRRDFDGSGNGRRTTAQASVPMSVHDDDREILLQMDVPGISRDDLDVTIEKGVLHVRGQRSNPQHDAACRYDERRYGEFERLVTLDETIDPGSVEASLEDGVLSIRLSRKPQAQPVRITVR